MTGGCTAVFPDSEAVLFLPKPVFEGLMRARQQIELKAVSADERFTVLSIEWTRGQGD
jgi:hypothetical protein